MEHYLQWLGRHGLWPLSKMQTSNITNVSNRFLKFENYGRNPEGFYWLDGVPYAGCQTPQTDLKGLLKQDVDGLLEKRKGLCLACVKQ